MAKRISAADKEQIRYLYRNGYVTHELARMYNVTEHTIDSILGRL